MLVRQLNVKQLKRVSGGVGLAASRGYANCLLIRSGDFFLLENVKAGGFLFI